MKSANISLPNLSVNIGSHSVVANVGTVGLTAKRVDIVALVTGTREEYLTLNSSPWQRVVPVPPVSVTGVSPLAVWQSLIFEIDSKLEVTLAVVSTAALGSHKFLENSVSIATSSSALSNRGTFSIMPVSSSGIIAQTSYFSNIYFLDVYLGTVSSF